MKKNLSGFASRWGYKSLVIILLCWCMPAVGQMASFKHYGLDKSIFPSRIECIDQTEHGELLIGTLAGLVIYDGYEFQTRSVASGLAESSISALSAGYGLVYIGHWAGNLSIYDMQADTFRVVPTASAFDFASVKQIVPLKRDSMLVVTSEGRLFSVSRSNPERVSIGSSGTATKINQVVRREGDVLILTDNAILRRGNEGKWEPMYTSDKGMRSLIDLGNGRWMVGNSDGLEHLLTATDGGSFTQEFSVSFGQEVVSLVMDASRRVWAMTEEDGVYRYTIETGQLRHFKRENGLSYNQVRSIFTDREGNVWIATAAGLDQFLGDAFSLLDQRWGLIGGIVWDVELADGKYFALTPRGIVIGKAQVEPAQMVVERLIELDGTEPKSLVFDGVDQMWILDENGRLWRLPTSDGTIESVRGPGVPVRCLEVVNGDVWVGTDEGVFVLRDGEMIEQLTVESGLAGNRITGIYYSKQRNEAWITVLGAPVTLYYDGKFRKFGTDEGISSSVIQDAAFDAQGMVWFATYDKGVFRFDGENSFLNLGQEGKLTSNTTFAIEITEQGVAWVGHNWGVDAYDPEKDQVRWYGEDDGFMGVEVNSGAMRLGPNGTLWLGTLMGLLHFDPSEIRENVLEPSLKIERVQLGPIDLLAKHPRMDFLSSENDLSVQFSSISLTNPERNRFYYRLRGAHENWKELHKPDKIEYLSLPAGDFTFELKACNGSGTCTVEPFALSFSIYPPFYRTWWFYTIVFILVILAIFFMDRYRVVNLLEQKNAVEEKLALSEQQKIDIDQERERVERRLEEDAAIIGILDASERERALDACDTLPHFKMHQRTLEHISSDGVLCFTTASYNLVIMVDTGVIGNASHAIRSKLRTEMKERLVEEYDMNRIVSAWQEAVAAIRAQFVKFKGIQWFLYAASADQAVVARDGMFAFRFEGGKVVELFSDEDDSEEIGPGLRRLNASYSMAVCTDGIFAQLNESGTKNYPRKRFVSILEEKSSANQQQIVKAVWSDLEEWEGAMEQFDDMTIYVWNHV